MKGDHERSVAGLRSTADEALLCIEALEKSFPVGRSRFVGRAREYVSAVDGVSFDVAARETFGLVGESGCGKSTIARCILRLVEATDGRIVFDGIDLRGLDRRSLRLIRRKMQIVFQDASTALDPRMSVKALLEEPLIVHGLGDSSERSERVKEILRLVGIPDRTWKRRPHEFSGGQRQRIGVARALILNPSLVILDEPVSAVDVSIQAQILNLLRALQADLSLTYVFIVHDLTIAEYFCDRVGVLYLGRIMELGESSALFQRPLHPYTVSLLSAVPVPDPEHRRGRERIILREEVSFLSDRTLHGCRFRPRCPVGRDREICGLEEPVLEEKAPGHWVACHFPGELSPDMRRLQWTERANAR